ncbi:DNA/RNA non-specific endonuclease [Lewinella sp. IMCC34183]|uniref:DNA/RNA non-specific endonuclease n=1 Tax=Lewinella sp. IMCC34183 TaxID=2248762 RepID=UPI000E24EBC3|nr:DNA/RNA non-specific endonuclease [Lewinella sp. IMCC34183]
MAKLRRNHTPQRGGAASAGTILKVGLFALILFALVWAFESWNGARTQVPGSSEYAGEAWFLPAGSDGAIIDHHGFVLSYNEDWEQADWVAYILTRDHLEREWGERDDNFRADPLVTTGSADLADYRGSGYDRGHLAPFADFAWNDTLADATFYLSNVSPQARQFNQGVWRELEELVRDWAKTDDRLYVVTGPVITQPPKGYIGRDNRVAIPTAYFKVLLDLEEPRQKGIAFLIPNEVSFRPLPEYVVSIDSVEAVTGLDFFGDLLPPDLEAAIESSANPDFWRFSKQKYDRRVNQWNNVK